MSFSFFFVSHACHYVSQVSSSTQSSCANARAKKVSKSSQDVHAVSRKSYAKLKSIKLKRNLEFLVEAQIEGRRVGWTAVSLESLLIMQRDVAFRKQIAEWRVA